MRTVWVFADQLNRQIASLRGATPEDTRVLFVHSNEKWNEKPWHKQRLHLFVSGVRHFAEELRAEGFEVDERHAKSWASGCRAHIREFKPESVTVMEPLNWDDLEILQTLDVQIVPSNQMLCSREDFAKWAGTKNNLLMENFYRWQRKRLDYLMDGDEPAGGEWNFDADNREAPPKGLHPWPEIPTYPLDGIDKDVVANLTADAWGAEPNGWWCVTRAQALQRLHEFVDEVLPEFGPYEDAMLEAYPRMNHSMLSHAINVGLLMPGEVVDAVEDAYRNGKVPIASAEGFVRQIIGWREYIYNVYWRWMPEYRDLNMQKAKRPLPPVYMDPDATDMHCMKVTMEGVRDHAWVHHIPRLMILANFAMLADVRPQEMVDWMWRSFIDGAEWVMVANVVGMAMFADGGRMATKPYAGAGAYINRMSDYCKGCKYDPKKRVGDDACPFTTLYWDFLDRHKAEFGTNFRMRNQYRTLERLNDMDEVRTQARLRLKQLDAGKL